MRALALAAALAAVLPTCQCRPPITPTGGDAGTDAAAAPVSCATASNHRASLKCADQEDFLSLCLSQSGQAYAACVASATTCTAIDSCDPALIDGAKHR